jgi:nucleotide-binding universal stress UspA family protein
VVVVGVDFSAGAAAALETGRALACLEGAGLCLVHVSRRRRSEWLPADREAAWLRDHDVDPTALHLRHGEPWVELVRMADEMEASLLVTGTHGESGFQPLRLGATASHVALRSRSPVVLVPPPQSPR